MSEGGRPDPTSGAGGKPPDGMGEGWSSLGTLLSGMGVWGGVGYLLDHWLGTSAFVPVGVVVGMTSAIYLVYKRAGPPPPPDRRPTATRPPPPTEGRP